MNRLTIKNSDGSYSQPTHTTFEKMFYKLAEFEDFLEEMKVDNLEELRKQIIGNNEKFIGLANMYSKNEYEYSKLKNKWQKLEEWLEDYLAQNRKIDEEARHGTDSSIIANIRIDTIKTILYKMLILEKQKTE